MIDDPRPSDWRDLQEGVCRLLNEVGLKASTEVSLKTPRGHVKVDVYAVDEQSVDKISYVVECKNWDATVPQSVVHAFTTVMHETGANIGFIISKHGLQSGADRYTANTNVVGLTYEQLQARYFSLWWRRVFCATLASEAETLFRLVSPLNSLRDEVLRELPSSAQDAFRDIQRRSTGLATVAGAMMASKYAPELAQVPVSFDDFVNRYGQYLGGDIARSSPCFRPLLGDFVSHVRSVTSRLRELLGSGASRAAHVDTTFPSLRLVLSRLK